MTHSETTARLTTFPFDSKQPPSDTQKPAMNIEASSIRTMSYVEIERCMQDSTEFSVFDFSSLKLSCRITDIIFGKYVVLCDVISNSSFIIPFSLTKSDQPSENI